MAQINPYIHFNGNAEEGFLFYQSVFGGEFLAVKRFKDMQFPEGMIQPEEAEKIMHIALPIGTHSLLMGSDTPAVLGKHNEQENRSKICITAHSKEEADQLFNALAVGGTVEMPMTDSGWNSYFGMLRDKFGFEWMIDFSTK
jgi:PhnB protein